VDMPKIDIDKLVFKPQVSIESSIKCAAAPLVRQLQLQGPACHLRPLCLPPRGGITLGAGPPGTQCTRHARAPRTILCRVRGGSVNKAYCPAFTRTVPEKAAYKNAANLQRLLKVLELAGELQSTQAYTLAASLVYDGQQQLKSGNAATDTWSDEVTSLAAEAASALVAGLLLALRALINGSRSRGSILAGRRHPWLPRRRCRYCRCRMYLTAAP
jgi:hypothetical protein